MTSANGRAGIRRTPAFPPRPRLPRPGPRQLPSEPEESLQRKIIQLAQMLGWRVYHPWTSIHSASGWPDLAMIRNGQLIFAELKSERGKVTADQQAWLDDLWTVPGVWVYIWRPSDWDQIKTVLGA